jgi:hypothetical protein
MHGRWFELGCTGMIDDMYGMVRGTVRVEDTVKDVRHPTGIFSAVMIFSLTSLLEELAFRAVGTGSQVSYFLWRTSRFFSPAMAFCTTDRVRTYEYHSENKNIR